MKNKLFASISVFAFICFVFYLAGSFAQASFSLKDWSPEARVVVATFGLIVALIAGVIPIIASEE